jgi:hypothetical protein
LHADSGAGYAKSLIEAYTDSHAYSYRAGIADVGERRGGDKTVQTRHRGLSVLCVPRVVGEMRKISTGHHTESTFNQLGIKITTSVSPSPLSVVHIIVAMPQPAYGAKGSVILRMDSVSVH